MTTSCSSRSCPPAGALSVPGADHPTGCTGKPSLDDRFVSGTIIEGTATGKSRIKDTDLFLSVMVTGEIRKGIELVRSRDRPTAVALERWLRDVERAFGRRILPVDARVADTWGKMSAIRPVPVIDGLLAATAKTHELTLATRNASDIKGLGATVVNPFNS